MITQEEIKSLSERINALHKCLNIDRREYELKDDEVRLTDPSLYSDMENANKVNKRIADNKKWLEPFYEVKDRFEELVIAFEYANTGDDMSEEIDVIMSTLMPGLEKLELNNMLQQEDDKMDAVIKLVAGAGGTESCDFCGMLARMYQMYFLQKGFQSVVSHQQIELTGGYKTISFQVSGTNAYGFLKSETGVHRLVRVSPFNAQGKRMTSFVSVYVTPLIDDTVNVEIDESRISYDYFRSGGAGGQNVNKVSSGVRARYQYKDPYTGEEEEILVENTETRDQPKNKENARRILKSILYEKEMEHRRALSKQIESSKKKIEWGSQIRSYVMDDRRVKDHRTNYQTSDVQGVLDGNLEGFVKAYLMEFGNS